VPTLCRKVTSAVSDHSLALTWKEIPRFNKSKRGLEHKLVAAREIASNYACEGIIAVVDRDGIESRMQELETGRNRIAAERTHSVAIGVAVESIEAWTLGDPEALRATLGVPLNMVTAQYRVSKVESYYENSGNERNRPKTLLRNIAAMAHRN